MYFINPHSQQSHLLNLQQYDYKLMCSTFVCMYYLMILSASSWPAILLYPLKFIIISGAPLVLSLSLSISGCLWMSLFCPSLSLPSLGNALLLCQFSSGVSVCKNWGTWVDIVCSCLSHAFLTSSSYVVNLSSLAFSVSLLVKMFQDVSWDGVRWVLYITIWMLVPCNACAFRPFC